MAFYLYAFNVCGDNNIDLSLATIILTVILYQHLNANPIDKQKNDITKSDFFNKNIKRFDKKLSQFSIEFFFLLSTGPIRNRYESDTFGFSGFVSLISSFVRFVLRLCFCHIMLSSRMNYSCIYIHLILISVCVLIISINENYGRQNSIHNVIIVILKTNQFNPIRYLVNGRTRIEPMCIEWTETT